MTRCLRRRVTGHWRPVTWQLPTLARRAQMVKRVRTALMPLRLDCSGATALEYALIAVFISIICVGWATFVGTSVSSMFMRVASGF